MVCKHSHLGYRCCSWKTCIDTSLGIWSCGCCLFHCRLLPFPLYCQLLQPICFATSGEECHPSGCIFPHPRDRHDPRADCSSQKRLKGVLMIEDAARVLGHVPYSRWAYSMLRFVDLCNSMIDWLAMRWSSKLVRKWCTACVTWLSKLQNTFV